MIEINQIPHKPFQAITRDSGIQQNKVSDFELVRG